MHRRMAARHRSGDGQRLPLSGQGVGPVSGRAAFPPDPPRSISAFRGHTAAYIRQPTSSLDWAGADWTSPVALDFKTETMTAQMLGARIVYPQEQPVHPIDLIDDMAELWVRVRDEVTG